MPTYAAPSTGNLSNLMSSLNQGDRANKIYTFLNEPSNATNYSLMTASIDLWISSNLPNAEGLRILVCLPDGTVCYETNKTNTHANFISKSINENHNSRVAVLQALLGNSGVGFETKPSTTSLTREMQNYMAQRIGFASGASLGIVRVSITDINS